MTQQSPCTHQGLALRTEMDLFKTKMTNSLRKKWRDHFSATHSTIVLNLSRYICHNFWHVQGFSQKDVAQQNMDHPNLFGLVHAYVETFKMPKEDKMSSFSFSFDLLTTYALQTSSQLAGPPCWRPLMSMIACVWIQLHTQHSCPHWVDNCYISHHKDCSVLPQRNQLTSSF